MIIFMSSQIELHADKCSFIYQSCSQHNISGKDLACRVGKGGGWKWGCLWKYNGHYIYKFEKHPSFLFKYKEPFMHTQHKTLLPLYLGWMRSKSIALKTRYFIIDNAFSNNSINSVSPYIKLKNIIYIYKVYVFQTYIWFLLGHFRVGLFYKSSSDRPV